VVRSGGWRAPRRRGGRARWRGRWVWGDGGRPPLGATEYGRVRAAQVTSGGATPPSGRPLPSRPWQPARGSVVAVVSTPSVPSVAGISRPPAPSPERKMRFPNSSSGRSVAETPPARRTARARRSQPARVVRPAGASAAIVQQGIQRTDEVLGRRQADDLLPQAGRLVAHDQDVGVVVLALDVLAEAVERPVDVLFLAGQEEPAGPRLYPRGVLPELLGGVGLRVDGEREEIDVLAQAVAQPRLQAGELLRHQRADAVAGGVEGVDDDDLALQEVA